MKSALFTTVCMLALAGPVAAAEAPRGYIGGAYGGSSIDAPPVGGDDLEFWTVQGHVSLPLGQDWSTELSVEATGFDGADTLWSPTGRLFFDLGGHRVGGFVGGLSGADFDFAGGGLEGRFALAPNWRLDAAVGYGAGDIDAWSARAELRLFLDDNTRLDAFADVAGFDGDLFDFQGWTAGVGAEHQFDGSPISLFGRYDHTETDDFDLSSDSVRVGLRWNFGGGTVRDRQMDGQSSPAFADLFGGDLLRLAATASALAEAPDDDDGGDCGGDALGPCDSSDLLGK